LTIEHRKAHGDLRGGGAASRDRSIRRRVGDGP
jgi:hypothetical protein